MPLRTIWTKRKDKVGNKSCKEYELFSLYWASLVAQMVKNVPSAQESWVWSLGLEDPLEEGMATRSSILAWRIPWTEETGRLQCMELQRVGYGRATNIFTFYYIMYSFTVSLNVGDWLQNYSPILYLQALNMILKQFPSRRESTSSSFKYIYMTS